LVLVEHFVDEWGEARFFGDEVGVNVGPGEVADADAGNSSGGSDRQWERCDIGHDEAGIDGAEVGDFVAEAVAILRGDLGVGVVGRGNVDANGVVLDAADIEGVGNDFKGAIQGRMPEPFRRSCFDDQRNVGRQMPQDFDLAGGVAEAVARDVGDDVW
jgi:hypothetical protein